MKKFRITKATFEHLQKCVRIAMFFAGIAIFLSTHNIFTGCGKPKPAQVPSHADIKEVLPKLLAPYEARITDLADRNSVLQERVASIDSELTKSQRKTVVLEKKVRNHVQKTLSAITPELPTDCDSLRLSTLEYMDAQVEKDSLYEKLAANLSAQVANRDSALQQRTMQNSIIQIDYERIQLQQKLLIGERDYYNQQFRRQRTKSRLLTVGLVIVGGTATGLLLRR